MPKPSEAELLQLLRLAEDVIIKWQEDELIQIEADERYEEGYHLSTKTTDSLRSFIYFLDPTEKDKTWDDLKREANNNLWDEYVKTK